MKILIEGIGWIAVLCLLGAYGLISFGVIDGGLIYQILNLIGALGLGLTAWATKNRQSLVVQIFWGVIGVVAILRLFF